MRLLDVSVQISDNRQHVSEKWNWLFFGIWVLIFGISLNGCISEPSRSYKKEFVTTYAELTLLYEKEKMVNKRNDSSYQVLVKEFFEKKGLKQDEFKKQAEELSKNTEVWKFFIQDVSAAMDSLKNKK